jgi:hypothetical protein
LYVGFIGKFDSLKVVSYLPVGEKTGKTYRLWAFDDVVEIFIGPEAKTHRQYREFEVSPDSRFIDLDMDAQSSQLKPDFHWQSHFIGKSHIDNTQKLWTCVMQIPWSAFDHKPQHGETWHCNFYRNTPDLSVLLAWSPVHKKAFHQPEKFGEILFE